MRFGLRISVLLNLGLMTWVICRLAGESKSNPQEKPPTVPAVTQSEAAVSPPTPREEPAKTATFLWSQLESTNYLVYIANLRAIRCPEQTIYDIVAADVDAAIYAPKRERLKVQRTAYAWRQNLEQGLEELQTEEKATIASLLGWNTVSMEVKVDTKEEPSIAMPLAFQNDVSGLDTNQTIVVSNIRQRFLREIGSQEDPNDPAYRERWLKAQEEANNSLKGMLGLRAYQAFDLKARAAALAQAGVNGQGP